MARRFCSEIPREAAPSVNALKTLPTGLAITTDTGED